MNEPAKILVVDDEDAGRFVKTQTLRRANFFVIEASTGADALALAARERPDVLVLDVNLPDISGLEVCRRLRTGAAVPLLQILQISNTAVSNADRVKGLEHGADVYLTEPVDGSVLVATVNALLRVRRAETALATALESERRARDAAERASRLKDEFIATLSHELRTPLNALMGWIWQLRWTPLGDKARERALDSLERNARMQAQLINDLLDVSRASKGKLQLEMRLVDLQTVVSAATEFIKDAVDRHHLDFRPDLASVYVMGDQSRLQQIVTNLLSNAVQFTPSGGRISVAVRAEGSDAVLVVEDTGAGISPELLPHVFDQFRQGAGGLNRLHGGLGLGLSVVKQLVDLHAGQIAVASPGVGLGSTFTVRLPREADVSEERSIGDGLLLDGYTVLLADGGDDPNGLRGLLESSGATVIAGPDAEGQTPGREAGDRLVIRRNPDDSATLEFLGSHAPHLASQSIPPSESASNIVRRIVRAALPTKTL